MSTHTLAVGQPSLLARLKQRSGYDALFALLVIGGAAYALKRYGNSMDGYEQGILLGSVPALIALGWAWGALRGLAIGVGAATLLAIGLYSRVSDGFGVDLAQGEQVFMLKYFLSSQSAILWMGVLFFIGTVMYWIGLFVGRSGCR